MLESLAETVYAVEPVPSLRSFMKDKAAKNNIKKLFVMDGTLDSIPLSGQSLDTLITSNAIGWNLGAELKAIESVLRPGGVAIHLLWSEEKYENPIHDVLISPPWEYSLKEIKKPPPQKLIYSKQL